MFNVQLFGFTEDCQWNTWESWSPHCSRICGIDGGGERRRLRSKQREAKEGGRNCTGADTEEQGCTSTEPCLGKEQTLGKYLNL